MKRLLPLLFLLPSIALIIYARRDADREAAPYEVKVRVTCGEFVFPDDVILVVIADSGPPAAVKEGWATLKLTGEGSREVQLHVLGPIVDGATSGHEPVGKPRRFEHDPSDPDAILTLAATPDECRAAMAAIPR